jgi:hypothetical protein
MTERGERTTYLVECYWPGVDSHLVKAAVERAQATSAELGTSKRQVELVESVLVRADETVFLLFEGTSEDVRFVVEQAHVPFERVLESIRIDLTCEGALVMHPSERD